MARPKKEQKQEAKVLVYTTPEIKGSLKEVSESTGKSVSEIGEEAIKLWLSRQRGGSTMYTMSQDTASLSGPLQGAEILRDDKSNVTQEAIEEALSMMTYTFYHAKQLHQEHIHDSTQEHVHGFVCGEGHLFWVDWASVGTPVKRCPVCSSQTLSTTWRGVVQKT